MINNNLKITNKSIEIYLLLNKVEREEFSVWIAYQTQQKIYSSLSVYLVQVQDFSKEGLLAHVFPKDVQDSYYRKVLSEFGDFVKLFVVQKEVQEEQSISKILLYNALRKRGYEHWIEKIPSIPFENDSFQVWGGYQEANHVFLFENQNRKGNSSSFEAIFTQLELYYCYEYIKWVLSYFTQQQLWNFEFQIPNQEVMLYRIQQLLPLSLELELYYHAFCLFQKHQEEDYFKFKTVFINHQHQLKTKEDAYNLYILLLNYCVKKVNLKNDSYLSEALFWYQLGFDERLLMKDASMTPFTYRNSIGVAIKQGVFALAEQWAEAHKTDLAPEHLESNYAYCKAWIAFEQGQYKGVRKYLQQIEFEDELLALNSKTILLKTYYELGEQLILESLLESFKSYIQRKKVQGFYKSYFLTLVKFTYKLITSTRRAHLIKLKTELLEVQQMASKEWLLEKIDQQLLQRS